MKYKVKMIHEISFNIECETEEQAQEYIYSHTIEEIKRKLDGYYSEDYEETIVQQMSNNAFANIKLNK